MVPSSPSPSPFPCLSLRLRLRLRLHLRLHLRLRFLLYASYALISALVTVSVLIARFTCHGANVHQRDRAAFQTYQTSTNRKAVSRRSTRTVLIPLQWRAEDHGAEEVLPVMTSRVDRCEDTVLALIRYPWWDCNYYPICHLVWALDLCSVLLCALVSIITTFHEDEDEAEDEDGRPKVCWSAVALATLHTYGLWM